jgi:hypothetical protein
MVVSSPLKDADVPAMTAKPAHSPSGTGAALDAADLRLLVVASAVANEAMKAIAKAKDLDAMLRTLGCCGD